MEKVARLELKDHQQEAAHHAHLQHGQHSVNAREHLGTCAPRAGTGVPGSTRTIYTRPKLGKLGD